MGGTAPTVLPASLDGFARFASDDGWPRARKPLAPARFRASPDDFQVTERLGFEPDGDGEFALVRVEKVGRNTAEVARELARAAGVSDRAVGWAGRKDRFARTRQWFGVHLRNREGPDWATLAGEGWHVLAAERHRRKLRIGALTGNDFAIVLRDFDVDPDALRARVDDIAVAGVPNYFGPQRFGRDGFNLRAAANPDRRRRRDQRSMLLSAARAALFNAVLAERVVRGSWNQLLDGEVPMLRASQSIFGPEALTSELLARCDAGEIDPSGALWGDGEPRSSGAALAIEVEAAARWPAIAGTVTGVRMRQERRRLRLVPRDFRIEPVDHSAWRLSFFLEAGAFATSVVREFIDSIASAPA